MNSLQISEQKIEQYVSLATDLEGLLKESRSLIRRKHSPLARRIARGDYRAIVRAAIDRIRSALSAAERDRFCKALCDLKLKLKSTKLSSTVLKRELIAWAASSGIGYLFSIVGAGIALVWVLREHIQRAVCACVLNGYCNSGSCGRHQTIAIV